MQYVFIALIIIALLYAIYLFIMEFLYIIIPICVFIIMTVVSKKIYNMTINFLYGYDYCSKIKASILKNRIHNNDFELVCSYIKKINNI